MWRLISPFTASDLAFDGNGTLFYWLRRDGQNVFRR